MNENLKKLLEPSYSKATEECLRRGHQLKQIDATFNSIAMNEFAELIIQKCVAISDDYVKDCACEEHINCKHPRSAIGRKIREHFGVRL
jgi:hypothetical protein